MVQRILYIILASLLNHTAILLLSLIIQLGRHGASDGGRKDAIVSVSIIDLGFSF